MILAAVANQVRVDDYFNALLLEVDADGDKYADYSLELSRDLAIEETTAGSRIFQIAVNKTLIGSAVNDTLSGGNGNDILKGFTGNDSLNGGYGADTLVGGDGADTLTGGLGGDILTGGAGNDIFKYNALADFDGQDYDDKITDFAAGDKIDLSAIDADSRQAGNQAFSFLGSKDIEEIGGSFTGRGAELYYSSGVLRADINGDQFADFSITMNGIFKPDTSSFIL